MKILQLIQRPQLRGAELAACHLSEQLVATGHQVLIVTLFPGEATLPFSGSIIHLRLSARRRFIDYSGWKAIADLIAAEQPDIVQGNAGDTLKYCVMSRLFFGWRNPLVFRNASMVSLYINNAAVRLLNDFFFRFVDHVVSVSELTRRDLNGLFPRTSGKSSVVPVGINPSPHPERRIEARSRPVLLHVGGFTFEKNHRGLLSIFGRLRTHCPTAQLWLVGDGPLRSEVESLIGKMGLSDSVTCWGYRDDPESFMASADALVMPSVIEGLPAVILEAFYFRLPVVAYDTGAISDLVGTNDTGWLVTKGDEDGFVASVIELMSDVTRRGKVTENAFEKVMSEYRIERVADGFLAVYRSLSKNPL